MQETAEHPRDTHCSEAQALRKAMRNSQHVEHTAGLASGCLQANIVILPEGYALDFMRFCQRNPKPCPLVGVSDTGSPMLPTLGHDIDIRTDIPAYNIYRYGSLTQTVNDIRSFWENNFVVFALGCSFTFESAMIKAGIALWHISNNKTVPMYRSTIKTIAAGPFSGDTVISYRAIHKSQVDEAVHISQRYPLAHGRPVHIGDPQEIGIADLSQPDWGDSPPPLSEGQVPVFWACGVTPQLALLQAKLPFAICHKPGHMLITDIDDQAEVPVYVA